MSNLNMELLDKSSIINYIKSIYNKDILENYQIGSTTVDLFFPKKKFGIDLSGYFWAKDRTPKQEIKIVNKEGFKLIHIYDYEWYNCTENFKTYLYYLLNSRNKKLCRNDKVVEISKDEFVEFIKNNHLFIDTIKGCSLMYGLYEGDELVCVSGFNKRKTGKYDWEWKRFCIKYGWMTQHNVAKLFLDKFKETNKGLLVDYQQVDRFNFVTDSEMGFTRAGCGSGVVCINTDTLNYTRHSFIKEKPLNKQETMEKYGFNMETKTSGTVTWVLDIE